MKLEREREVYESTGVEITMRKRTGSKGEYTVGGEPWSIAFERKSCPNHIDTFVPIFLRCHFENMIVV